jgi:YD repeat-containing protein
VLLAAWLAGFVMAMAPVALAATVTYTYDQLDRLVRATYSNGTVIAYTYDAAGNILTRSIVTGGAASGPLVTTGAASNITAAGATLNGTVSSNGASTTVIFQFGPTTSYDSSVSAAQSPLPAAASVASVSATVSGLPCNALHHFRAVGVSSAGTSNGADASFTTGPCPALNATGLWWNANESGWGINFSHQADIIFATWFTYDAQRKPWWLIAELHKTAAGVYAGAVSTMTGPPFNTVPFPPYGGPGGAADTPVGTMTATFADAKHATLAYTVNATTQTKAIVPQEFGSLPSCVWGAQPNLALATNYTDLWWNSNESGWGVNFTHQGDIIFATWFTYDAQGKPWWLIAELHKTAAGVYAGSVSTMTGPPFNTVPFPPYGGPGGAIDTSVGTATVTFTHGNAATFAYAVNGTAQSKTIARQVFASPGTVCQ